MRDEVVPLEVAAWLSLLLLAFSKFFVVVHVRVHVLPRSVFRW